MSGLIVWLVCYFKKKRRLDKERLAEMEARLVDHDALEEQLGKVKDEVDRLQEAWRIDPAELRIVGFVAQGGEGRVYRGIWRSQFDVAVKALLRDPDIPEDHGFSNSEVKAMQRLRGSRPVRILQRTFVDCYGLDVHTRGLLFANS